MSFDTLEQARDSLPNNEFITLYGPDNDGGLWVFTAELNAVTFAEGFAVLLRQYSEEEKDA